MSESNTDRKPAKSAGKKLFRIFILLAGVFVLFVGSLAFAGYAFYAQVTEPRDTTEVGEFVVVEGVTGSDIAVKLAREGFVEHALYFRVALKLDSAPGVIKHGVYQLPKGASAVQLVEELQNQTPDSILTNTIKVTLAEGLTLRQMAQQFEDAQAFLDAANEVDVFGRFGVDTPSPEGFLMPNTYFFDNQPSAEEVVERMAQAFEKTYMRLKGEFPDIENRDLVEIVTIASIIEEEARLDEERPIVAGVIYNRLEKKMPLEMDSTLQYALNKYGERLLTSDTEVDSPYNTYKRRGLPPGPISNPGEASLRAAIAPADVDFLFFVSNADGGSHTFSTTLKEHNRAVAKYRKAIREQRRKQ